MALAADWLTSAWDQNAGLYVASPTVAVLEEIAGRWLNGLFGLPEDAGVGFVTGGQMANFTGLAAARHALLARAGWNVSEQGCSGPRSSTSSSARRCTSRSSARCASWG